MWKIVLLIILISVIVLAIFLWTKYSPFINSNKIGFAIPIPGHNIKPSGNIPGNVLGDNNQNPVDMFFNHTKDSLQENSQNLINTVKDQSYNQIQNTVNTIYDKPSPQSSAEVNISVTSSPSADTISIDFLKDTNLKLNLNKGNKYHLQFKNIPAGFCVYISGNKYQINDAELIDMQFNSSGTYPIRLNLCGVDDKNLGDIVVQ